MFLVPMVTNLPPFLTGVLLAKDTAQVSPLCCLEFTDGTQEHHGRVSLDVESSNLT